jgi:hypothetical protein
MSEKVMKETTTITTSMYSNLRTTYRPMVLS